MRAQRVLKSQTCADVGLVDAFFYFFIFPTTCTREGCGEIPARVYITPMEFSCFVYFWKRPYGADFDTARCVSTVDGPCVGLRWSLCRLSTVFCLSVFYGVCCIGSRWCFCDLSTVFVSGLYGVYIGSLWCLCRLSVVFLSAVFVSALSGVCVGSRWCLCRLSTVFVLALAGECVGSRWCLCWLSMVFVLALDAVCVCSRWCF